MNFCRSEGLWVKFLIVETPAQSKFNVKAVVAKVTYLWFQQIIR